MNSLARTRAILRALAFLALALLVGCTKTALVDGAIYGGDGLKKQAVSDEIPKACDALAALLARLRAGVDRARWSALSGAWGYGLAPSISLDGVDEKQRQFLGGLFASDRAVDALSAQMADAEACKAKFTPTFAPVTVGGSPVIARVDLQKRTVEVAIEAAYALIAAGNPLVLWQALFHELTHLVVFDHVHVEYGPPTGPAKRPAYVAELDGSAVDESPWSVFASADGGRRFCTAVATVLLYLKNVVEREPAWCAVVRSQASYSVVALNAAGSRLFALPAPGTPQSGSGDDAREPTCALGDLTQDGIADVVVGSGAGVPAVVLGFDGMTGASLGGKLERFTPYNETFNGGVSVAIGDFDGDGIPDIVTGAGPSGGPHVRVFRATDLQVVHEKMAFDPLRGFGIDVAVADLDGDGAAEILVTERRGGSAHVVVIGNENRSDLLLDFLPAGVDHACGQRVAVGNLSGASTPEIVVAPGGGCAQPLGVYAVPRLAPGATSSAQPIATLQGLFPQLTPLPFVLPHGAPDSTGALVLAYSEGDAGYALTRGIFRTLWTTSR